MDLVRGTLERSFSAETKGGEQLIQHQLRFLTLRRSWLKQKKAIFYTLYEHN